MFVPVNQPNLSGNEKKYLCECIDSGWISSEGPFVKRFEREMAEQCNRNHGVAVANGSVALDTAVVALEIGTGDEVIMPVFTIISCVAAVIRVGAKPIFVDADAYTWNMDVSKIEAKITSRTKAIMVVHIYGLPTDMQPVLELAKKYNLKIIEDAAEAHGQNCYGQPCGSFGDVSTFSFYPNKHVTCGEGGMVLVNDKTLAQRCMDIRNLFFDKDRRYLHSEIGYNFRMTNLQAAVGCAQLERLAETVLKKKTIGKKYTELLTDISVVKLPLKRTDYADNIYWVFGLVLNDSCKLDATSLIKELDARGVQCRHFFYPLHKQPCLQEYFDYCGESYPVAERLAERGLYLPSGVGLTEEQQQYVAQQLKTILD
ncbi:MAG: DegT/DnrJ/EryC1/StrS family aminotransferase [Negativicutes bacterium]|jgi:perosamine synthetase